MKRQGTAQNSGLSDHLEAPARRAALTRIFWLGSVLTAGLAAPAFAQHSHGSGATKAVPAPKAKSPNDAVIAAARRCESVGNICLRHCIRLNRAGDKSIYDCMRAVQAMLPVCVSIRRLAVLDARRLKDMAKLCMDVCSDCEAECRKHEFHHVECKNCAEACAAMVEACKRVLGA